MSEIKKSFFSSFDVEKKPSELCIFTMLQCCCLCIRSSCGTMKSVERQQRLFCSLYVNERGTVAMTEVYSALAFVLILVALAKVIDNIKK